MYSAPTTSFSNPVLPLSNFRRSSFQNCRKYMSKVKSWKRWRHVVRPLFLYHQTVAPSHCQAKLWNNVGFNPFKIINCISVGSNVRTNAWHSYLILLNMSPVWKILTNWLSVVASWKYAVFSFTKKVSGTQISLIYSAPTTSLSRPGRRSKDNLGSCQNCRKYMSRVKSWKSSSFNKILCSLLSLH